MVLTKNSRNNHGMNARVAAKCQKGKTAWIQAVFNVFPCCVLSAVAASHDLFVESLCFMTRLDAHFVPQSIQASLVRA